MIVEIFYFCRQGNFKFTTLNAPLRSFLFESTEKFHNDGRTFHTLSIRFSNKDKSAKCISMFMLGMSNQKLFILQLICVILALYLD